MMVNRMEHLIESHSQEEPFLMHQTHLDHYQPAVVYDPDFDEPYYRWVTKTEFMKVDAMDAMTEMVGTNLFLQPIFDD